MDAKTLHKHAHDDLMAETKVMTDLDTSNEAQYAECSEMASWYSEHICDDRTS